MPSPDIGGPTMTPPRHGTEDLYTDVVLWNGEASPFYPEADSH